MKYTIEFLLKGPARTLWAPNTENPVEATDLKDVLQKLVEGMPETGMVACVGVRVQPVDG
jgi:hypothetical protein